MKFHMPALARSSYIMKRRKLSNRFPKLITGVLNANKITPILPPRLHVNMIETYGGLVKIKEKADRVIPNHEPSFSHKTLSLSKLFNPSRKV